MEYWVFEDSLHDCCSIHTSNCLHLQSEHYRDEQNESGWYGPFKSYREALDRAWLTQRPISRTCDFCQAKPEL